MFVRKNILILMIATLLLFVVTGNGLHAIANDEIGSMPEGAVGGYYNDGKLNWIYPGVETDGLLAVDDAEAQILLAVAKKSESKIVHDIPPYPVIIDGTKYEPVEISLFDGKQLGFTVGNDGLLYAFTTEKALADFQKTQITENNNTQVPRLLDDPYSYFYEDWLYGGSSCYLIPGEQIATLGILDDKISSFKASSVASKVRLYDGPDFTGDYFERPGGTQISMLTPLGWNDRASSIIAYE